MKEFEIGDDVTYVDLHDNRFYGKVIETNSSVCYPIEVEFVDGDKEIFTRDGRVWMTGGISLHHSCESENIHFARESVINLINDWRRVSGENTILTSATFKQWAVKNNLR